MENWRSTLLDLWLQIDIADEFAVLSRIQNAAGGLGFDYVAYALRLPLPFTNPKVMAISSYPARWRQRYEQQGYVAIDPILVHGWRSRVPLIWNDDVFQNTPIFRQEAKAEGVNFGWSQSSIDTQGLVGVFSLARASSELTHAELTTKENQMCDLVRVAHLTFSHLLMRKFKKDASPHLTQREVEVLKWAADGKSAEDISRILKISVNTVNFHIKNSMIKLNTTNKTAAVLKAAMLGLLRHDTF